MTIFFAYGSMFRVKQWPKNLLVFLPVIILPGAVNGKDIGTLCIVFTLFCCCSSIIYIVNDWTDRRADALHQTKKHRPFASGELGLPDAIFGAVLLSVLASILIWQVPHVPYSVLILMCWYVLQSLAYSFWLKHITLLEMMIVSTGYAYRALAGGLAVDSPPSSWMLTTILLASIYMVAFKRLADMADAKAAVNNRRSFNEYSREFLLMIAAISASASLVSYLLFTFSGYAQEKFANQYMPLSSLFVIFAVFRYAQIAVGSAQGGDPLRLIFRDSQLRACIFLCVLFLSVTNGFSGT